LGIGARAYLWKGKNFGFPEGAIGLPLRNFILGKKGPSLSCAF